MLGVDEGLLDGQEILELGSDLDLVAGLDAVRRDVDALAVDGDVAVAHGLAGFLAGAGEAQTEHDVVETGLEDGHEVVAGDALTLERELVVAAELLLENAIDELGLLLLLELRTVLALLAAAHLGLTVGLFIDSHDNGIDAEGAAPLKDRRPINCHCSYPS